MPDPNPYGDDPYGTLTSVLVEHARRRLRKLVSRNVADQLRISVDRFPGDPQYAHHFADVIAVDVETAVLTEKLPPQRITHRVRYEHPEAVGQQGVAADARHATWFDHFVATYRGRWWGRLLRLHRREVRYQFVPVPYIVSRPVHCDHEVTVDVHAAWTYPRATMVLPGDQFGHPVLAFDRADARSRYRRRPGHQRDWRDDFSDMVKGADRLRPGSDGPPPW